MLEGNTFIFKTALEAAMKINRNVMNHPE